MKNYYLIHITYQCTYHRVLLAVLEARCGLNFSACEVYLNVSGGYRLADPAADLAVAAALVSALAGKPLSPQAVWFGEISLAGEVRPVAHGSLRQRESAKLGFAKAFGPPGGGNCDGTMRHESVALLPNLVDRIMGEA